VRGKKQTEKEGWFENSPVVQAAGLATWTGASNGSNRELDLFASLGKLIKVCLKRIRQRKRPRKAFSFG
jgi:hypothetical protein